MHINEHSELIYDSGNLTYDSLMEVINMLIEKDTTWSRKVHKKYRHSLSSLLMISNKDFISYCIENLYSHTQVICRTSYQRMICYRVAALLNIKVKKIVENEMETISCNDIRFGKKDECNCHRIKHMWNLYSPKRRYQSL